MNEKICYRIWQLHTLLMVIPNLLLLVPAAIFKNLLAFIAGLLHMTLIVLLLQTVMWTIIVLPMLLLSGLSRIPVVGWMFSVVGLPVAMIAEIFLSFMPSFAVLSNPEDGDARAYWSKVMRAESYPFSIEFSPLGNGFSKRTSAQKIFTHFCNQPILRSFLNDM